MGVAGDIKMERQLRMGVAGEAENQDIIKSMVQGMGTGTHTDTVWGCAGVRPLVGY